MISRSDKAAAATAAFVATLIVLQVAARLT